MCTEVPRLYALASEQVFDIDALAVLDHEERARSARFVYAAHRNAFVTTRIALRYILGSCLRSTPGSIRFMQNPWGKPLLSGAHKGKSLHFSVSHSSEITVIAISRSGPIGVDIERRRLVPERDKIAEGMFGPTVARRLSKFPKEQQDDAFLRLWTAGEATIKAHGLGFAGTRTRIPVLFSFDSNVRLDCTDWSLAPISALPGYIGSMVGRTVISECHACLPERTSLFRLASVLEAAW